MSLKPERPNSLKDVPRLAITWRDLCEALEFCETYLELELYRPRKRRSAAARAISLAIVVSYGRPFSGNLDASGKRESESLDLLFDTLDAEGKVVHEDLITARNQAFAHSDARVHRITTVNREENSYDVMENPRIPLNHKTVEQIRKNVRCMKAALVERLP